MVWVRIAASLLLLVVASGCAGRRSPAADSRRTPAEASLPAAPHGRRVVAHAQALAKTGTVHPGQRPDCSGFVLDAYRAAGRPLAIPVRYHRVPSVSAMLHDWSREEGRTFRGAPAPGDVVFFRDTTGPIGGRITHVALVERVREDGTVELLHFIGGRIRRDPMNLARPSDHTVNGWLRRKKSKREPALAGELFVAYARFHP